MVCLFGCNFGRLIKQPLFLERTDCLRTEFHLDLFSVYYDSFGLEIWLPDFLGVALRKADIAAKLLAFTG